MFQIVVILCLLVFAPVWASPNDLDLEDLWTSFKQTHNKYYSPKEEKLRRQTWEDNLNLIQKHNLEADLGKHTHRLGLNKYADLSFKEFHILMTGTQSIHHGSPGPSTSHSTATLPDEVDWRKQGYVTPVRDQKDCGGGDWAITAAGAVEGQHFKATGKLVPLSAQNLLDCSKAEGNSGCEGGLPYKAYKYIIKNQGIDTEASYPYVAKDQECAFKADSIGATLRGYLELPSGNEMSLQQAVAGIGPISISIDSYTASFHLYKSGIYNEGNCSSKIEDLDHAVLVVGYGVSQGQDYWLVKNSWGTSWGEQGYIRMSRNKQNQCGIATRCSYPVV